MAKNFGDLQTNPARAIGLPAHLLPVKWAITGGAGAVGSTTGTANGVTITRTGVGAYRIDYPTSPAPAYGFFVASATAQPTGQNFETAGQVTVTFAADPANGVVIQGFIISSPSRV